MTEAILAALRDNPGLTPGAKGLFKYLGFPKREYAEFRRSLLKKQFVASCRKLVPEVRDEDLTPGGSGVRAQALGPDGNLVDDFRFVPRGRFLHVLNVPSPAATASLPIGREILRICNLEISKL